MRVDVKRLAQVPEHMDGRGALQTPVGNGLDGVTDKPRGSFLRSIKLDDDGQFQDRLARSAHSEIYLPGADEGGCWYLQMDPHVR